jgi:uncharacterized protein YcbK (DUF882 family)
VIDWNQIRRFAELVDAAWSMAGQPPVRLTSWYRDPANNARVGGHPQSQHLLALAIDFLPDHAGARLADAARSVGLVVIDEGDHFHVQRFPSGQTPSYLLR